MNSIMPLDKALARFKNLIENSDEETSGFLKISMTHVSAKNSVESSLRKLGIGTGILEEFLSLGKDVIQLFSYEVVTEADGIGSIGKASLKSKEVKLNLKNSLVNLIQTENLGTFGPGEVKVKLNSNKIWDDLAYQFIGALSYKVGIRRAFYLLEALPLADQASYLPEGKDPKTLLQEYFQKHMKLLPRYELLKQSGSPHTPQFHVIVKANDGRSAIGIGSSKKLAEQEAAKQFFKNYISSYFKLFEKDNENTLKKFEINKSLWMKIFKTLPSRHIIQVRDLIDEFQINDKFMGELSLALIHSSYNVKEYKELRYYSGILSFLGSAALMWAVHDIIFREYLKLEESLKNIFHTPIILANIINERAISEAGNILDFDKGLLMGTGQTGQVTSKMKAEVVQAIVGCLFLARKSSIISGDDLLKSKNNKFLSWISHNIEKSFSKKPENLLHPKTRFQEQCQAIGIKIIYELPDLIGEKVSMVKVKLLSQDGTKSFLVSFIAKEGKYKTRKDIESRLAVELSNIFQVVNGIDNNIELVSLLNLSAYKKVADFIFTNCFTAVNSGLYNANTLKFYNRTVDMKILGLTFLQNSDFSGFTNWLSMINSFLLNDSADHYIEELLEFYRNAGREGFNHRNKVEKITRESTRGLSGYLDSLDPLNSDSSVTDSIYFKRVNESAKVLRLMGSPIRIIGFKEIKQEISIIFRNQEINIYVSESADVISLIEIMGSHLTLIQFLLEIIRSIYVDVNLKLFFDYQESLVVLKITNSNSIESWDPGLEQNLEGSILWNFLKETIPIAKFELAGSSIITSISSNSMGPHGDLIKKVFLAFNFGIPLDKLISDTIPGILHDLKNELLAYQSAVKQINKVALPTQKYFLATEASKHIDKAREYANAISAILRTTDNAKIQSVPVASFFRDFIIGLISSSPHNIIVNMPSNTEEVIIYTDVDYLKSILVNLCQNSIDAMSDGGRLYIEWIFDSENKVLEIEIQDTGCGFDKEQLKNLNSGIPISSSKKHGTGIGLSTVMMMAKRISGLVRFATGTSRGAMVNIFIPSLDPEAKQELIAESINSVPFEDSKDTIEL